LTTENSCKASTRLHQQFANGQRRRALRPRKARGRLRRLQHVQDTGDGRSNLYGSGFGPDIPEFRAAQTFPLKYQSPLARYRSNSQTACAGTPDINITATTKISTRVKAFTIDQAYRAQHGYTSVLWVFLSAPAASCFKDEGNACHGHEIMRQPERWAPGAGAITFVGKRLK